MVLTVRLSKTIQFQERIHTIPLASIPGSRFCPVAALDMLLRLRNGQHTGSDDLVFMVNTGGCWEYLCKPLAQRLLEAQIVRMGLVPTDFRFHSFRFGSLQDAVLLEPSLEVIRLQSDHLSDAIHGYCGLPATRRFRVTQQMGSSLAGRERDFARIGVIPAPTLNAQLHLQ